MEGETLGDLSVISMSNIGIGKAKAPNILKKICDIYTDKSSIKSLLTLKKKGKEVKRAIENASFMYMQFILAQIFAMYAYYFIDDNILFKDGPIILLALNNTMKERLPKSNVFINMLSYIVLSITPIIPMEENTEIVVFLVLTINMIINLYSGFSKKIFETKNIIYTLLYIIIVVIGIALIYKGSNFILNITAVSVILIFVIIYLLMIWLVKKWQ